MEIYFLLFAKDLAQRGQATTKKETRLIAHGNGTGHGIDFQKISVTVLFREPNFLLLLHRVARCLRQDFTL